MKFYGTSFTSSNLSVVSIFAINAHIKYDGTSDKSRTVCMFSPLMMDLVYHVLNQVDE